MKEASAKAIDKTVSRQETELPDPSPSFLVWLRAWRQVIIAELLHLFEHRRDRGPSS